MCAQHDWNHDDSDDALASRSSEGVPDNTLEEEGYEEGDALTEEMGESVEEDQPQGFGEDLAPHVAVSPFDRDSEPPAAEAPRARGDTHEPLAWAAARALAASRFGGFVDRVASAVERQAGRAGDAATASRLRRIHTILRGHPFDAKPFGLLGALSRWHASTGAAQAVPVMAGIVAWIIVRGAERDELRRMPVDARKALVDAAIVASGTLVGQHGHGGMRALGRIAASVARIARRRATPASQLPAALSDSVTYIASQPGSLSRLTGGNEAMRRGARGFASRAGIRRRFRLDGPVSVTVVRDATGC